MNFENNLQRLLHLSWDCTYSSQTVPRRIFGTSALDTTADFPGEKDDAQPAKRCEPKKY